MTTTPRHMADIAIAEFLAHYDFPSHQAQEHMNNCVEDVVEKALATAQAENERLMTERLELDQHVGGLLVKCADARKRAETAETALSTAQGAAKAGKEACAIAIAGLLAYDKGEKPTPYRTKKLERLFALDDIIKRALAPITHTDEA